MSGAVTHRKLVRDRIPSIIIANGGIAVIESWNRMITVPHCTRSWWRNPRSCALPSPLSSSGSSPTLDVVKALAADTGHTLEQVIDAAAAKTAKHDGFEDSVWLEETRD